MPAWHGSDKEKERLHDGRPRGKRDRRGYAVHKDKRKKVPLSLDEVKAPSWMSEEEKVIFEDMRANIFMFDIATASDKYAFQLLCLQYAQYFTISRVIAEEGYMIEVSGNNGMVYRKPHPLLSERGRLNTACKASMKEFGMTPSTRLRILRADPEKPESEEEDEWDELLN